MDVSTALNQAAVKVTQKVAVQHPVEMASYIEAMPSLSSIMGAMVDLTPTQITQELSEKATEVEEFARSEADKLGIDPVAYLKSITYRLGVHDRDERTIERLHRFVSIRQSIRELSEQERALYETSNPL